jgi:hypothetical protein
VQRLPRLLNLGFADALRAVEDLALQVGEVDVLRIGEGEAAEAGGGEVERCGTAQAAGPDYQRGRRTQSLLPLDADFGEQDVAAVAEELLVVQLVAAAGLLSATVGAWLSTGWPLRWFRA